MRRLWMLSVLLIAVIVLTACGGGGAATTAPQATTPPEATKAPEKPAMVGDVAKGEADYNQYCIACHGPGATGVQGLGKSWVTSEFIKGQTDDQLVAFIKVGRPASDPANTTGVDMPPKGGNPALNDQQLYDIVAYMRSINKP